jgi:hypothetical protein
MINPTSPIRIVALALLTCLLVPDALAGLTLKEDMFLGVWSPLVSKWERRVPVCVWNEDGVTLYRVTATGLAPGANFAMTNDIGDEVGYRVFWHTGKKLRQRERLRANTVSRKVFQFDNTRQCRSGPNAQLRIRANKRDIDSAIPGIYNDTLLLVLSPL